MPSNSLYYRIPNPANTFYTKQYLLKHNEETAVGTQCSLQGAKFHFQIGPLKLQFVSFKKSALYDRQLVGTYAASYKAACYCIIFSLNEWQCVFVSFDKHSFTYAHTQNPTCSKQPTDYDTSLRELQSSSSAFGNFPKHQIFVEWEQEKAVCAKNDKGAFQSSPLWVMIIAWRYFTASDLTNCSFFEGLMRRKR